MSRFNLPDVDFAVKESQQIENELIEYFESEMDTNLADADPRKKMLQSQVPILTGQRATIDNAAKMNLLAYAAGDYLDHIGIMIGVTRLPAAAATVTQRFTLSQIMNKNITIPAGTRVTAGDGIFFAAVSEITISSGQLHGDVVCQCLTDGTVGNGYDVGDLNIIVDPIAYVAGTANLDLSEGGADSEDDASFRERIREAPEKFSTAGPDGAYIYWAKTASVLISDVSVSSPAPGIVDIRVLLQNGEIPGDEVLNLVYAACNDSKRRPLTDKVEVKAPEVIKYNLELTYYIDNNNSSIAAGLKEKIESAVRDYVLWQKSALGRDINPSELIYLIKNAGAKRVEITVPEFTELTKSQVAIEEAVDINYGGLEDG